MMSMGLNLKDEETVALVSEVAKRTGTTKTAAVRELARKRLEELDAVDGDAAEQRYRKLLHLMETEIWPNLKPGPPITKEEIEEITGMNEMFDE